MPVLPDDIERIAQLSKLILTENEKEVMIGQVNKILEYVDKLGEVDTTDVPPLSHPNDVMNVFREDEIRPSLPREIALSNAPQKSDRFFRVPKVIRK